MAELLKRQYTVVDIEGITLSSHRNFPKGRFSRRHNCIRKISFEFWDNSTQSLEFRPCVAWHDLDDVERRSFSYCKKHIHGLPFNPRLSSSCTNSVKMIEQLLKHKQADVILYKGGQLERDLADKLQIECRNLEEFGVPKFPAGVHNPQAEVHFFHEEFLKIVSKSDV